MSTMSDSASYVTVCGKDDLAPGKMRWVAVNGERVLLANVGGEFCAVSDRCGHQFASLSRGRLIGHEVECPLHFATFDVRTGKCTGGPDSKDIACYQVLVMGDDVRIKPRKPGEAGLKF